MILLKQKDNPFLLRGDMKYGIKPTATKEKHIQSRESQN